LCLEPPFTFQFDLQAKKDSLPGANQAFPGISLEPLQKEDFDSSAGILSVPEKSRPNNPTVIEYQDITTSEKIRQLIESMMTQ
jgi:hypothetical protein